MNSISISFSKFPTHVKISSSRRAKKDKDGNITNPNTAGTPNYKKINSQFIYSGSPQTRAKVVDYMKEYMKKYILSSYDIELIKAVLKDKKVKISIVIEAPYNYGDIKMLKGEIFVKPVADGYIPRWDIGNLGYIWSKCFDDVLIELGLIKDDNVSIVIATGGIEYKRNDNFNERSITFNIEYYG